MQMRRVCDASGARSAAGLYVQELCRGEEAATEESVLMPKQLTLFSSLDPNSCSFGWQRDDIVGVIHVIARAEAPEWKIVVSDGAGGGHWPCRVCAHHGYTRDMFAMQILAAARVKA